MQKDVFTTDNKKVGTVELPDDIFGVEVKEALLWEQVKAQLASHRRGTHKTKKRGEVSGGGIKPYKQKGTGRARQGSSRAPNHVGGGKVFGPVPRDYSYHLPRSSRRAALKSALSLRTQNNEILILDKIALDAPKTKELLAILAKFDAENILIVDAQNQNLMLSARNLPKAKVLMPEALNVYDILGHKKLCLTSVALDSIVKRARGEARVAETAD